MLNVEALQQSNIGTVLLTRIAGFTGFLHANGYGVSAADSVDIVDAAAQKVLGDGSQRFKCTRIRSMNLHLAYP